MTRPKHNKTKATLYMRVQIRAQPLAVVGHAKVRITRCGVEMPSKQIDGTARLFDNMTPEWNAQREGHVGQGW